MMLLKYWGKMGKLTYQLILIPSLLKTHPTPYPVPSSSSSGHFTNITRCCHVSDKMTLKLQKYHPNYLLTTPCLLLKHGKKKTKTNVLFSIDLGHANKQFSILLMSELVSESVKCEFLNIISIVLLLGQCERLSGHNSTS